MILLGGLRIGTELRWVEVAIQGGGSRFEYQTAIRTTGKVPLNFRLHRGRQFSFQIHANQVDSISTAHASISPVLVAADRERPLTLHLVSQRASGPFVCTSA